MGMYCCCGMKITCISDEELREKCTCDWERWISIRDWPPWRKNKDLPFAIPCEDGKYLVRYQNDSGDHYEVVQEYTKTPREVDAQWGYTTGKELVHWSGDYEEQPYAWRELHDSEDGA